jgi:hypothetical protein
MQRRRLPRAVAAVTGKAIELNLVPAFY